MAKKRITLEGLGDLAGQPFACKPKFSGKGKSRKIESYACRKLTASVAGKVVPVGAGTKMVSFTTEGRAASGRRLASLPTTPAQAAVRKKFAAVAKSCKGQGDFRGCVAEKMGGRNRYSGSAAGKSLAWQPPKRKGGASKPKKTKRGKKG